MIDEIDAEVSTGPYETLIAASISEGDGAEIGHDRWRGWWPTPINGRLILAQCA